VAVTEYAPSAERAGTSGNDHDPEEHEALPDGVDAPVTLTFTVATSPTYVPHDPATDDTVVFVRYGKATSKPFTLVSKTEGGVVSAVVTVTWPLEVLSFVHERQTAVTV